MDALILSCGTGGGHNSAGKAVMHALADRGHRVVMKNPYTLCSDRLARRIDRTYISTATKAPWAFGLLYGAGELYRLLPYRSPVYFANQNMSSAVEAYLAENHFDIVIMPHLFPAEILTGMKRRGIAIPKTIFVATDYSCIPFTEETDCDAYVIPSADLASDFYGKGIPEEKLYPYGIPTDQSFEEAGQNRTVSVKGLESGKKYILISGGSIGAGKIEKLVALLLAQISRRDMEEKPGLITVCGGNQELYEKLHRQYGRQVIVVGHTDHMADYLRASCLYITKPGGLSSTEAAVFGIPLIHMPPIPGCESHNAHYFQERGMSLSCEVSENGIDAVFRLLNNAEAMTAMTACQRKYITRNSAGRICELAERMAREPERGQEPVFHVRISAGI